MTRLDRELPPGSGTRRRRARLALSLLALGTAALSAPHATAQAPPGLGPEREVGMAISLRPALSPVAGRYLPLLGLGAAVRLSPAVEVGGEGVIGLGRHRLPSEDARERTELTLGYGGVSLRYHLDPEESSGLTVGLLIGAATARMRSALVDAELGSQNFFVVEPSLAYRRQFTEHVHGAAWAGYRVTPGATPFPGMAADEFRGHVISLALTYVRDP